MLGAGLIYLANAQVTAPMIQGDEGGYLCNAAAIAGYFNDMISKYHAGYSLLLAPVFRLAEGPQQVWTGVRVVNAALYGCLVFLLWQTAFRLFPDNSARRRLAAVLVVAAYPLWVIMAGYAFAQIAFAPVYVAVLLAFVLACRQEGWGYWLLAGVLAGYLYWIHPSGLAVLGALTFAGGWHAFMRRAFLGWLVMLAGMLIMLTVYHEAFVPWLHGRMNISGLGFGVRLYPDAGDMLERMFFGRSPSQIVFKTAGHLFYLIVGSLGLFWLGMSGLCRRTLDPDNPPSGMVNVDRPVALFLVLSTLGLVALSVLMFSRGENIQRLDHWMYGRYVEGVLAPVLLCGVIAGRLRDLKWALVASAGCALVLWLGLRDYTHIAHFNIPALWQAFDLEKQGVWAWFATGLAGMLLLRFIPRRLGMALPMLVFLYAGFLQIGWHVDNSLTQSKRWSGIAATVRNRFAPGTCVGFNYLGLEDYPKRVMFIDLGFQLYDYRFQRMRLRDWALGCDGPMVSYNALMDEHFPEIQALTRGSGDGPVLWMQDGRLRDRFQIQAGKAHTGSLFVPLLLGLP